MDQRKIAVLGALGVLAETDRATIADVRDTLQHTVGNYWGASTGVIGSTMTSLVEDGHIQRTLIDGVGRYRITESGIDRLRSLLREPIDDLSRSPLQPQLAMQFAFLHHLPRSEQREEIDALTDRLQTARSGLEDVKARHETTIDDESSTDYRGELLLLRIFVLDALLDWLDALETDRSSAE